MPITVLLPPFSSLLQAVRSKLEAHHNLIQPLVLVTSSELQVMKLVDAHSKSSDLGTALQKAASAFDASNIFPDYEQEMAELVSVPSSHGLSSHGL
jgi:hypothetical protein